MHLPILRRRALVVAAAALACVAAAFAVVLLGPAPRAESDINLNNLDCRGSVTKGNPVKDEVGETNVRYSFACNGPITGYSLLSSNEIQGYETEVFGTNQADGSVYPNDSFSCNGDLPGFGMNCVGNAGWLDNAQQTWDPTQKSYVKILGNFSIDAKDVCAEPRTEVTLIVRTATKSSAGVPVQSIAGPFGLGRPQKAGCKATARSGQLRVPKPDKPQSGDDSDVG